MFEAVGGCPIHCLSPSSTWKQAQSTQQKDVAGARGRKVGGDTQASWSALTSFPG